MARTPKIASKAQPVKAAKKKVVKKVPKRAKKSVKKAISKPRNLKSVKIKEKKLDPTLSAIVEGLEEKKANNIAVLNLSFIASRPAEHFVIADGESRTHVIAIAESVQEMVRKLTGEKPLHSEGWSNAEWIVLDYFSVLVHIFQRETRHFYALENLWADAEKITTN